MSDKKGNPGVHFCFGLCGVVIGFADSLSSRTRQMAGGGCECSGKVCPGAGKAGLDPVYQYRPGGFTAFCLSAGRHSRRIYGWILLAEIVLSAYVCHSERSERRGTTADPP